MTTMQRIIKYAAIALAMAIIVGIFTGVAGLVTGITLLSNSSEVNEELLAYDVNGKIESLNIDVSGADLYIKEGEEFDVQANYDLRVKERNGTLKISEKSINILGFRTEKVILITIPKNTHFDKVKINAGAGSVDIDSLVCNKMEFEVGAGAINIGYLEVDDEAEFECGVGDLKIRAGKINDVSFELGLGKVEINASVMGKSKVEAGMGQLNLTIPEKRSLYTVEAETGLGELRIDGERINGNTKIGDGENRLSIEGGIGSVSLEFDSK